MAKSQNQEEKMYTIIVPEDPLNQTDEVFVSINERTWKIKRGIEVEVPECVALLFKDQKKALKQKEANRKRNAK